MNASTHYEFTEICSMEDEARFFSLLGRFFASPHVRRECGGYPLNDSPFHRWFVAVHKADSRVVGFASIEHRSGILMWREAYVRAEARGRGVFRTLRQQVLTYVDCHQLTCTTRVPDNSVPFLEPHGFTLRATRGKWATLERKQYAR
ncbi:GNAT family N-acetyltransferase [Pseudomonas protegens]|uniref:GNAT family N-acetyltransferase n=1 Tax=Pseudomonas protegens TaxID=380021 RepID=UPI001F2C7F04|nr:GNAT family N-acetyltransferase [Pseudomonas protegens]